MATDKPKLTFYAEPEVAEYFLAVDDGNRSRRINSLLKQALTMQPKPGGELAAFSAWLTRHCPGSEIGFLVRDFLLHASNDLE